MGLPRLYGRVGLETRRAMAPPPPPSAVGANGVELGDKGVEWTVAYYVILVLGAYGFYAQLFPLTESTHALSVGL